MNSHILVRLESEVVCRWVVQRRQVLFPECITEIVGMCEVADFYVQIIRLRRFVILWI